MSMLPLSSVWAELEQDYMLILLIGELKWLSGFYRRMSLHSANSLRIKQDLPILITEGGEGLQFYFLAWVRNVEVVALALREKERDLYFFTSFLSLTAKKAGKWQQWEMAFTHRHSGEQDVMCPNRRAQVCPHVE